MSLMPARSAIERRNWTSRYEATSPDWRSRSTSATVLRPEARAASASWTAVTVVPTPPLAPATVTTVPPGPGGRRFAAALAADGGARPRPSWAAAWTRAGQLLVARAVARRRRGRRSPWRRRDSAGPASAVTRTTPTAGKRRAISRISSSAGTGPMRSWTRTTSGSSSRDSAASRARVSSSWVESATGGDRLGVGQLAEQGDEGAGGVGVADGRQDADRHRRHLLTCPPVEGVGTVRPGPGGVAAGGDQREPDVLGEGLGVGDALGVLGVEREGDRHGLALPARLSRSCRPVRGR